MARLRLFLPLIVFVVLELQKKLIEAEAAQLRARADYNQAVSEYHRQTGTALREHGVVLE